MAEETAVQPVGALSEDGANAIKSRLESVNQELRRIESTVKKDQESLERLRDLLDSAYIQKLLAAIEDLEARITSAGADAVAAHREAELTRARLIQEEERLEKLWDAYTIQETELREAEARAGRLAEELAQKDAATAHAEHVIGEREAEVRALREERATLRARVEELEAARAELKQVDALKERIAEAEARHAAEKERLAKLYVVYEELAEENERLQKQIKERDEWIARHAPKNG
ncbi:MAG TPA: hypothetical protein VNZ52_12230 [Candidatus Thermoplasmatota archaeon]|nr:hypothetical protein [Candidatus Thermoplasmatota archaeon]